MKILQGKFSEKKGWITVQNQGGDKSMVNLVLVFGSRKLLSKSSIYEHLRDEFPNARILLSSTAGDILDSFVFEDSVVFTAIEFEKTQVQAHHVNIMGVVNSFEAGKSLAQKFNPNGLKGLFLISDGQKVNGTELVTGMEKYLPKGVIVTGGLAGDGDAFKKTLVGLDSLPAEGGIVAVGFYGQLVFSYGTAGGWEPFGPERLITKSDKNILLELDGKPALDVYKTYLGKYSTRLPASALLFPLGIWTDRTGDHLVRTVLSINEKDKSMVFAGNMPEGAFARFMRSNCEKLVDASLNAAKQSIGNNTKQPELAILISCVGRKLVMDQSIEEEVEAVKSIYGNNTVITGFYSYGEISPSRDLSEYRLNNQTMSITTLNES